MSRGKPSDKVGQRGPKKVNQNEGPKLVNV